jgi:hypothetical protein
VRAQRVGVIGVSRATAGRYWRVRPPSSEPAFAVAVVYYPGRDPREPSWASLETDTLIRMDGAAAGPRRHAAPAGAMRFKRTGTCGRRSQRAAGLHAPRRSPPSGHYVGQDPVAMGAARVETRGPPPSG